MTYVPPGVIDAPEHAPTDPASTRPDTAPARTVNAWIQARRTPPAEPVRRLTRSGVIAVAVLGVLLLCIVGVAFRGSWTAHRDAALAAHFDQLGADLYPFAPDGLIVIALIAAMVLRHDRAARAYALSIVGIYTLSSYLINQWHGLGWFTPDPVSGAAPAPHWPVIGLIAGQLIGAIFLGSHLLVFVLRHLFPGAGLDQAERAPEAPGMLAPGEAASTPTQAVRDPDPEDVARKVYEIVYDLGHKVGRDKLATICGIPQRAAVRIRQAVQETRELAEVDALEQAATKPAADSEPLTDELNYALTGATNGGAP